MKDLTATCRLALIQAAPVMFDSKAATEKAVKLIQEASSHHPDLIVFPELFIPGYPYGLTFGFTVGHRSEEGRKDWLYYYNNSILIPGPETDLLGKASKEAHAYLSIGVSERDAVSGTLYNSNIVFRPDGEIDAVHRKLKPTGAERLINLQRAAQFRCIITEIMSEISRVTGAVCSFYFFDQSPISST